MLDPTQPASQASRTFAVTNRSVLAIAVPMTLAYLTTPLLGIVDTAVVGQFGDAALLGGLAAGAIIFDLIFSTFNFLRSGTTGLVAQAFGRGDDREQLAVLLRAIAIALVSGLAMALLARAIASAGAWFMQGEPRVTEALVTYVQIRFFAAPLALVNYAILGYVLGRGEGAFALALQVLINGANIVFAVALGLWLGYGVAGVAWGAVCGEAFGALAGLLAISGRFRRDRAPSRLQLLDRRAFMAMVSLNRDIMIRSFVLLGAFALFTRAGAGFGTLTLAANAVLMNFFLVAGYFLDGFASAAEQLAGRAIGAGDGRAFRRAVKLTTAWGFALAGFAGLVLLLFGSAFIVVVTTAADVRASAIVFLPWAALTAVSGVLAFQMDGVFIGATWSRDMRNMMLLSFAVFLAALNTLPGWLGNHGLWAALHIFLLVRGLSLVSVLPRRTRQAFGTA